MRVNFDVGFKLDRMPEIKTNRIRYDSYEVALMMPINT